MAWATRWSLIAGPFLLVFGQVAAELVKPSLPGGPLAGDPLLHPPQHLRLDVAGADTAGIVLGARVPIILTSRADSVRSRMASCAVASLYANARRMNAPLPAV